MGSTPTTSTNKNAPAGGVFIWWNCRCGQVGARKAGLNVLPGGSAPCPAATRRVGSMAFDQDGSEMWESKSLNCWQVAAPGDSPGGCRRGSAACQQFARPERQAAGLMRRDSHHRGCHRDLIAEPQDQRRAQPVRRPERQAEGLMRRDSHHRGCHRALIPGHQDQRRISGVPASDSSLRSSPLRGRHRLRRCGPLLPSLRFSRTVARPERQAAGLMRRDSHHRTGGACPPGAIRPSTW